MFARASIILPTLENQIILPQTAITFTLYGDNVYVVNKDDNGDLRARQSVVETGERDGAVVHILKGVKVDDTIVTSGQVRLSNDAKVHIVESNALEAPAEVPML